MWVVEWVENEEKEDIIWITVSETKYFELHQKVVDAQKTNDSRDMYRITALIPEALRKKEEETRKRTGSLLPPPSSTITKITKTSSPTKTTSPTIPIPPNSNLSPNSAGTGSCSSSSPSSLSPSPFSLIMPSPRAEKNPQTKSPGTARRSIVSGGQHMVQKLKGVPKFRLLGRGKDETNSSPFFGQVPMETSPSNSPSGPPPSPTLSDSRKLSNPLSLSTSSSTPPSAFSSSFSYGSFSSSVYPCTCLVVAVAPDLEKIHQHWMYIQQNIRINETSVETVEALSSFYEIKFSALSNIEETKNNPPSSKRPFQRAQTLLEGLVMSGAEGSPEECEEFFRDTFSLKDEKMVKYYLDCNLLIDSATYRACVFLSKKYLCIATAEMGSKLPPTKKGTKEKSKKKGKFKRLILPFSSIVSISVGNISQSISTSFEGIRIRLETSEKYVLSSFSTSINCVLSAIVKLWRKNVLQSLSEKNDTKQLRKTNSFLYRFSNRDREILDQYFKVLSEEISSCFPPLWRLPPISGFPGTILIEDTCTLWLPNDMFKPIEGYVFMASGLFCFRSKSVAASIFYLFGGTEDSAEPEGVVGTIPLLAIQDITQEKQLHCSEGSNTRIKTHSGWNLYFSFSKDSTFTGLLQLWELAKIRQKKIRPPFLKGSIVPSEPLPNKIQRHKGFSNTPIKCDSEDFTENKRGSWGMRKGTSHETLAKESESGIIKDECAARNWFVQFFEGSIELTFSREEKRRRKTEGERDGEKENPCYGSTGEIACEEKWKKFFDDYCQPNLEAPNSARLIDSPFRSSGWGPEGHKTSIPKDNFSHLISVDFLKTNKFLAVIRKGIPNYMRSLVWQLLSGSLYLTENCAPKRKGKNTFQDYLTKNESKESISTLEIDRDLHRTLPAHPFFQTEKGLASLRRVLVAYSWRNPEVGYCQSLNVITALLLCFLTEEQAFWMLSTICEEILPDRYTPSMIGTMVDQSALKSLLKTHLSEVANHLEEVGVPIPLITLPWFMCMFIGYLPWEANLRVLDCFFAEGVIVFYRVALSVMNILQDKILEETESMRIIEMLKNIQVPAHQLMSLVYGKYASIITPQAIADQREFYYPTILEEMEQEEQEIRNQLSNDEYSLESETETCSAFEGYLTEEEVEEEKEDTKTQENKTPPIPMEISPAGFQNMLGTGPQVPPRKSPPPFRPRKETLSLSSEFPRIATQPTLADTPHAQSQPPAPSSTGSPPSQRRARPKFRKKKTLDFPTHETLEAGDDKYFSRRLANLHRNHATVLDFTSIQGSRTIVVEDKRSPRLPEIEKKDPSGPPPPLPPAPSPASISKALGDASVLEVINSHFRVPTQQKLSEKISRLTPGTSFSSSLLTSTPSSPSPSPSPSPSSSSSASPPSPSS